MEDATTEFFEQLRDRGHEPMLAGITGTFRFDLEDGDRIDRWCVSVSKGDVSVSKRQARADCVLRMRRELFDRVATGEHNAVAALMRGEVALEGDWNGMVQIQRLFPGPAASRAAWEAARRGRRRS